MKKLVIISAIAISGMFYNTANAQIRVHFGLNFWPHRVYVRPAVVDVQAAPVVYADDDQANYDASDDYYYLPDVGAYYSVNEQCYYYFDGDNWISAAYLPGEYRDYDWRNARRYEVRAPRPYLHDDMYRAKFHGATSDWAHYAGNVRTGNDGFNHDAYNNAGEQHLDNRVQAAYAQANYNRGDQQPAQNQDRNRVSDRGQQPAAHNADHIGGQQQKFAQNNKGYNGHDNGRRMF